jgi:lipopolysaccharide biosynthesis glycosyltransferase
MNKEIIKLKNMQIENIRNNLIDVIEDETRKFKKSNLDICDPMQSDIIKNLSIAYNNLFGKMNEVMIIDVTK